VASAGPPLITGIVATDKWLTRFRTILVAVLGATVLGIACLAFYTSFEAIRDYAVRSNGIAPEHGWAVPLMVDSFIVVALGADLWFTTTRPGGPGGRCGGPSCCWPGRPASASSSTSPTPSRPWPPAGSP
jgi:hypothetical protein